MTEAKRAEMVLLIKQGTVKLVNLLYDHEDNLIPSRYVLALKHAVTG